MKPGKILIVDDEKDIRNLMEEIFAEEGYQTKTAANGVQAKEAWRQQVPDVIFLDIWMPDIDGITLLKEMQTDSLLEQTSIVMMSGHGTIETAIEATKLGAYDFLEKPLSLAKLIVVAERALQHTRLNQENRQLRQTQPEQILPIGKSKAVLTLRETIERLTKYSMPILVTGEAGSGKKHFAKALHKTSDRKEAGLQVLYAKDLNHLTEPEHLDTAGLLNQLRAVDGGTLVVTDAEQLTEDSQLILANLLTQQCFNCHILDNRVELDIRLILLSKVGIEECYQAGNFREDLYQRLQVMPIHIPALRQHSEDIPELIEYFINQLVSQEGLQYRHFSVPAQNTLRQYSWPGNLRELQNLIQKLLILGSDDITDDEVKRILTPPKASAEEQSGSLDTSLNLKQAKDRFERAYFSQLLRETSGNVSETAKRSGVDRTNLYRKLKALQIDPKNPV